MVTVDKDFGMRVKLERTARRLTQPDFARLCDISKPTLVALERHGNVSAAVRAKVETFLAGRKGV